MSLKDWETKRTLREPDTQHRNKILFIVINVHLETDKAVRQ